MTIKLTFPSAYSRPKVVEMHTDDNIHGWRLGMTFCSDDKCECGWPKVKAINNETT